jgi:hypothetical protein
MWASWVDEYIQWDPSQFNDTRVIQIQSWRLWQVCCLKNNYNNFDFSLLWHYTTSKTNLSAFYDK